MIKSVAFDLSRNTIHMVESSDEYDRYQIESTLYLKCLNRISLEEWNDMYHNLNYFKCNEMVVHKDSLDNTKLH